MLVVGIYLSLALLFIVFFVLFTFNKVKVDRFTISMLFGIATAYFLSNAYEEYHRDKFDEQVKELLRIQENVREQQNIMLEILD